MRTARGRHTPWPGHTATAAYPSRQPLPNRGEKIPIPAIPALYSAIPAQSLPLA
ncbi:MAG: hypothetical protein OXU61_10485 [Gammaproteobacteria bacterium]|nr:hypothetical protein [Gammaproteobacteria bacterium]